VILKLKQLNNNGGNIIQMINFLQTLASGTTDIEGEINSFSLRTVGVAALVLVALLGIASQVVNNKKMAAIKKPLFIMIALTIITPTLLLAGSTVYINTISESKGPVHWHTDIEMWVCGQEIELRNPTGFLSNKIGTSTYHEHDDKRIHLEGVVVEKEYDASLEKFFDVTDGDLEATSWTVAVEEDVIENDTDGDKPSGDVQVVKDFVTRGDDGLYTLSVENGNDCGDGEQAQVQAFLFRYDKSNETYTQTKLENPKEYIMRDESIVPPGDCVIVEFDTPKNSTDRLCQQYGVRDTERCTQFGVSTYNPELCNIKQIVNTGGTQ
jgi:hypothetical protein